MLYPKHLIPGELPAGTGMELPRQGSREQAQLHPPSGELHWSRRKEEWLVGILLQTTVPKTGAHLKGKDRESKREVKVPSGTVRISGKRHLKVRNTHGSQAQIIPASLKGDPV